MADYSEEIEAYLEGRLSKEQRAAFEDKIRSDAAFREAFEASRQLHNDLEFLFAEGKVVEASRLQSKYKKRKRVQTWIWAGLLAILLAGFWYVVYSPAPTSDVKLQNSDTPPIQTPESQPTRSTTPQAPPHSEQRPVAQGPERRDANKPLFRSVPDADLPAESVAFFESKFQPALPFEPVGIWQPAWAALQNRNADKALQVLQQLPRRQLQTDTALYLLATAHLLLKQPAQAEAHLYTLNKQKKWPQDIQWLLAWTYLLQGKDELSLATLRMLPDGFRDKAVMRRYLEE